MRFSAFSIQTPAPPSCPVSVDAAAYPRRSAVASALLSMLPFQPPLPVASNLPFQLGAGIQTSILMSESGVGFSVAAIRQNAGRSPNGFSPPRPARPPPAGLSAPAATASAVVILAFGRFSEVRLSHDAAEAGSALNTRNSTTAEHKMTLVIFDTSQLVDDLCAIISRSYLPASCAFRTSTDFSICASRPLRKSAGVLSTYTSGGTP